MQAWSPALGVLGSEPYASPDFVPLMGGCVEHRLWHTGRAQLMSEQRGAQLSKAWPPLCSDLGVSVGQWLLHRSNLQLPHDDLQQDRGPQGGVVKGSRLEPGRPEPESRPCSFTHVLLGKFINRSKPACNTRVRMAPLDK